MLSNKQTQKVKNRHLSLTWWHLAYKRWKASKQIFGCKSCAIERHEEPCIKDGLYTLLPPRNSLHRRSGYGSDRWLWLVTTLILFSWGSFLFGWLIRVSPSPGPNIITAPSPAGKMLFLPGPLLLGEPDLWAQRRLRTPWHGMWILNKI